MYKLSHTQKHQLLKLAAHGVNHDYTDADAREKAYRAKATEENFNAGDLDVGYDVLQDQYYTDAPNEYRRANDPGPPTPDIVNRRYRFTNQHATNGPNPMIQTGLGFPGKEFVGRPVPPETIWDNPMSPSREHLHQIGSNMRDAPEVPVEYEAPGSYYTPPSMQDTMNSILGTGGRAAMGVPDVPSLPSAPMAAKGVPSLPPPPEASNKVEIRQPLNVTR